MNHHLSPGLLAQVACILEATARKPGNVHRFADFADCTYLDFILSASAIAGPLDRAREIGVGASVLEAVAATRRVVASNTNLGIILLLAPLAAVPETVDLRTGVEGLLERLTTEDTRLVYHAIRLAAPGGLGDVPEQDVRAEPTIPLREAMRLAAGRDSVARQYANGFAEVFAVTLPVLRDAVSSGRTIEEAILDAYLHTLSRIPDSLIARKLGRDAALEASRRASGVLDAAPGQERSTAMRALDAWLRAGGHGRNPGTTADLTTAALFAALREGTIRLPLAARWSGDWTVSP